MHPSPQLAAQAASATHQQDMAQFPAWVNQRMDAHQTYRASGDDLDSLGSKAHKRGAPCPQDESSRKPYLKSPLMAGVSVNCDTARQKSSSLRTMWDNADNCDLLKQEIGLERTLSRTSALLGLFADFRPQIPGISQSHIHRLYSTWYKAHYSRCCR